MVPTGTKELKSNISIFGCKFGPNMDLGRSSLDPIWTRKSIFKEGSGSRWRAFVDLKISATKFGYPTMMGR